MPERQVITSLVGTVAPLLTVDTADQERLDYNSLWQPRQWKKSTPFVIDDIQIQPAGQTGLGIPTTFEINKEATGITTCVLRSVAPQSTVNPPAAQAAYADFLGMALIDYFNVHFGSNLVYNREGQDLYFKYKKAFGIEKQAAVDENVQGNKTLAQRNQFLLNGGNMYTDVMLPFSTAQSNELPIVTLSNKTNIQFRAKALPNITTSNVPGTVITNLAPWQFTLRLMQVQTTGDEAAYLLKMSQMSQGIAYMIHQNVRQNSDDFATTQSGAVVQARLASITKPLKALYWGLIPTKLINDTGRNDIFMYSPNPVPTPPGMTNYSPIESWRIDANGLIIQREIERQYNQVYQHSLYHNSIPDDQISFQTYAEYPHSVNAATGYLDYTNLNNATIYLRLGAGGTGVDPDNNALPQTLRLQLNCEDYNFWFFKSGNWSRSFN